MSEIHLYLEDEEATISFGRRLAVATYLNPAEAARIEAGKGRSTLGAVIHLFGDLGAGKTTLTRGLLRGYGHEGAVKSPTYTLVEPYEFEQCHIYHFDLYRLADPEEVAYLGTDDYFEGSNLCIIEWADRGAGVIPTADIAIRLEAEGTGRKLYCQSNTEKGAIIAKRLRQQGRKSIDKVDHAS